MVLSFECCLSCMSRIIDLEECLFSFCWIQDFAAARTHFRTPSSKLEWSEASPHSVCSSTCIWFDTNLIISVSVTMFHHITAIGHYLRLLWRSSRIHRHWGSFSSCQSVCRHRRTLALRRRLSGEVNCILSTLKMLWRCSTGLAHTGLQTISTAVWTYCKSLWP